MPLNKPGRATKGCLMILNNERETNAFSAVNTLSGEDNT